jgi:ADP-heptose:LPS heptosyltransferase
MNVLIVRLGALGDIVHAIPAAAALRRAYPDARIDWLVDARHREIVDLITVLDRVVAVDAPALEGWIRAVRELRAAAYDVALDLQGLMKSAVLARASGARRIIGFSIWHLREKSARPFYSEVELLPPDRGSHVVDVVESLPPDDARGVRLRAEDHVIHKNLRLLRTVGVESTAIEFPLRAWPSLAAGEVRREMGEAPFALLNPGAAWPNKRWPPERFSAVAAFLRDVRGLRSVVLWGPGEAPLAHAVVEASDGAATLAPPTRVRDLLELARAAALMISGDTGPLHIAAAAGTPLVAIFGPTDPRRNGPFTAEDVVVSRYESCSCHYRRRCRRAAECLTDVSVAEVAAGIQQRLSRIAIP